MAGKNGAREARLAAALKENLKRRKAQARAKAQPDAGRKTHQAGVAPLAGFDAKEPVTGPKSAPKPN
jgi:hypothetical protein